MGTLGTFGSFTQARLGIYASQKGLSVSGNNISNINTTGYTRQSLDQTSLRTGGADRYYSAYDVRVGNGVICTGVSQLRDPYLDIRYRSEMSSVGAMDTKLSGLENIQSILDEVGDGEDAFGIIEAQMSAIYDALQQLSDQTGQSEYDIQVRSTAEALTKQFNSYAAKLDELYENTVKGLKQDVQTVNGILTRIRDLNSSIRKSEIHGDSALEQRDARNLLIDQLSEYMKIDVSYVKEDIGAGQTVEKLIIKLGDANPDVAVDSDTTPLVDGIYAAQISIDQYPKPNPDYDALDPDSFQYLKADGTGTNDISEAEMLDDPNYDMTLSELKDVNGTILNNIVSYREKAVSLADYHPPMTSVTDPATGVTTITTYRSETRNSPMKNPDYDEMVTDPADIRSFRYLATDEHGQTIGTNDAAQADRAIIYYAHKYEKTPSRAVSLDDNDLYGALQAQRELLTEAGEFTPAETIENVDESAKSKRGIPYYQNVLNLLAHQFATSLNNANQGYIRNEKGEYVDADGNVLKFTNADGTETVLTTAMDMDDPANADYKNYLEANGKKLGCALFVPGNGDGENEPITAGNITISAEWASGPQIVSSFVKPTGMDIASTDSSNISHMLYLFTKKMEYLPNTLVENASDVQMFDGTFQEMWVNIGTVLGNDMRVTSTMLDTYYASSVELDTSRDSVSSVDLNDEAMNLMQYSKSYNAACRLMTTLDSVLDKLINGTGMTT